MQIQAEPSGNALKTQKNRHSIFGRQGRDPDPHDFSGTPFTRCSFDDVFNHLLNDAYRGNLCFTPIELFKSGAFPFTARVANYTVSLYVRQ